MKREKRADRQRSGYLTESSFSSFLLFGGVGMVIGFRSVFDVKNKPKKNFIDRGTSTSSPNSIQQPQRLTSNRSKRDYCHGKPQTKGTTILVCFNNNNVF